MFTIKIEVNSNNEALYLLINKEIAELIKVGKLLEPDICITKGLANFRPDKSESQE